MVMVTLLFHNKTGLSPPLINIPYLTETELYGPLLAKGTMDWF